MTDYRQARLDMVELQISDRGVEDKQVLSAMEKVPRHLFVPSTELIRAYEDGPLPIGEGQTISQPYIVGLMTEALELKPQHKVLEIGTGSGYQTAILAELAAEVFTLERIPVLSEQARLLLEQLGYSNIHFRVDNGFNGWAEEAPFDAIITTCAPVSIPEVLKKQLTDGGKLVIPVGPANYQNLLVVRRQGEKWRERSLCPVRFVPMVEES